MPKSMYYSAGRTVFEGDVGFTVLNFETAFSATGFAPCPWL
jgi:hypothetical protein